MQRRAAVVCNSGLGDAVISLMISNNFHLNGWDCDTYHDGIRVLQDWFSHLSVIGYPKPDEVRDFVKKYDMIVVFHSLSSEFVLELIRYGKEKFPEKIKVLYPYPSKNLINEPYYSDSLFDVDIPMGKNLERFCKNILKFEKVTKSNGFHPPIKLVNRKYFKRVVLHVKSSREGKNWPRDKYVKLALHLKKLNFNPVVVAGGPKDEGDLREYIAPYNLEMPAFKSLGALASYLYESGYLIGNDSGIGHLASSFNLPTVIISRRKYVARFWMPFWTECKTISPYSLIPNIRGFRLRDRKWKSFVTVKRVLRAFKGIYKKESQRDL